MRIRRLNLLIFIVALVVISSCAKSSLDIGTLDHGDDPVVVSEIGSEPRIVSGEAVRWIYSSNSPDSSEFNISYEYYSRQNSSYVMDSSYKDSVNTIIYNSVRLETYTGIEENREPLTKHFFEAQLDSLAEGFTEEEDEYSTLWSLGMSTSIDEYSTFVELTVSGWSYTGGAHGNGYVSYTMIDKDDGRELGLDDFFTDINALNTIAEPHFRTLYDMPADQSLSDYGFWFPEEGFTVNDNFAFGGGGVIFYYNSYEIAPYAGGPTELVIPLDEIKHLLKREF